MLVRAERAGDQPAVANVVATAFGRDAEAILLDRLRAEATPTVSLVAVTEEGIVGQVFLSPVNAEVGSAASLGGLAPLAVAPLCQRRGIGAALVRAGLAAARRVGWGAVFVLGDPIYYRRFGFEPAAGRGFAFGVAEAEAAFQVVELEQGALTGASGRVSFHDAFDDLE